MQVQCIPIALRCIPVALCCVPVPFSLFGPHQNEKAVTGSVGFACDEPKLSFGFALTLL